MVTVLVALASCPVATLNTFVDGRPVIVRLSQYRWPFDVAPVLTRAEGMVPSITPCLVSLLLALLILVALTWSYHSSRVGPVSRRSPYHSSWVVVPTSLISAEMLMAPWLEMCASTSYVSNNSLAACRHSCWFLTLQALLATRWTCLFLAVKRFFFILMTSGSLVVGSASSSSSSSTWSSGGVGIVRLGGMTLFSMKLQCRPHLTSFQPPLETMVLRMMGAKGECGVLTS